MNRRFLQRITRVNPGRCSRLESSTPFVDCFLFALMNCCDWEINSDKTSWIFLPHEFVVIQCVLFFYSQIIFDLLCLLGLFMFAAGSFVWKVLTRDQWRHFCKSVEGFLKVFEKHFYLKLCLLIDMLYNKLIVKISRYTYTCGM